MKYKIKNVHPIYQPIFDKEYRKKFFLSLLISPRGSMKTTHICKLILYEILTNDNPRIVIFRQNVNSIKNSIYADLMAIIENWLKVPEFRQFFIQSGYILQDSAIKRVNLNDKLEPPIDILFVKGIKTQTKDSVSNNKGIAKISIAIFEEGEGITDKDAFNAVMDSLREENVIAFFLMNVKHKDHFIVEDYFLTEKVKDEYFVNCNLYKLKFKEELKEVGVDFIFATSEDNTWLSDRAKLKYKNRKNDKTLSGRKYYGNQILGYALGGDAKMYFEDMELIEKWRELYKIEASYSNNPIFELVEFYEMPKKGITYVLGADTSTGKINGDFSSFDILNTQTGLQVAKYKGKLDEKQLAYLIYKICKIYGIVYVNIERNMTGETVQRYLIDLGFDLQYLYYTKTPQDKILAGHPPIVYGTTTNGVNRMPNLAFTRSYLYESKVKVMSKETINAINKFTFAHSLNRYEGEKEDDSVFSLVMACLCFDFYETQIM